MRRFRSRLDALETVAETRADARLAGEVVALGDRLGEPVSLGEALEVIREKRREPFTDEEIALASRIREALEEREDDDGETVS